MILLISFFFLLVLTQNRFNVSGFKWPKNDAFKHTTSIDQDKLYQKLFGIAARLKALKYLRYDQNSISVGA